MLVIPNSGSKVNIDRILIPIDFHSFPQTEIFKVRALADMLKVEIELLHITFSGETSESFYDLEEAKFFKSIDEGLLDTKTKYTFYKRNDIKTCLINILKEKRNYLIAIPRSHKNLIFDLFHKHLTEQIEPILDKSIHLILNC